MKIHTFRRETFVPRAREEVFAFFSSARNLESITPPFLRFHVLTPDPIEMRAGTLLDYKLNVRGLPMRWRTEITEWNPPFGFRDIQLKGPYAMWDHTHRFEERDGGTWMEDEVRYALGFGVFGEIARRVLVERDVRAIFDYRAERIRELFTIPAPR